LSAPGQNAPERNAGGKVVDRKADAKYTILTIRDFIQYKKYEKARFIIAVPLGNQTQVTNWLPSLRTLYPGITFEVITGESLL
jgi:hypothetical protein